MRCKNNLLQHELIGLEVKVLESSCVSNIGLEGTLVDETKNMLIIRCQNKQKKIPKTANVFQFKVDDELAVIPGELIKMRSEDRTKRLGRKKILIQYQKFQEKYG